MSKLLAQRVPHLLTPGQKQNRVTGLEEYLVRIQRNHTWIHLDRPLPATHQRAVKAAHFSGRIVPEESRDRSFGRNDHGDQVRSSTTICR